MRKVFLPKSASRICSLRRRRRTSSPLDPLLLLRRRNILSLFSSCSPHSLFRSQAPSLAGSTQFGRRRFVSIEGGGRRRLELLKVDRAKFPMHLIVDFSVCQFDKQPQSRLLAFAHACGGQKKRMATTYVFWPAFALQISLVCTQAKTGTTPDVVVGSLLRFPSRANCDGRRK